MGNGASAAIGDDELRRIVEGRDAVLAAVANAASRFLRGTRWDDEIDAVLESLGRATGVDRTYLFTIREDAGRILSFQLSEWVAPGVEPQLDLQLFQGFDMAAGGFQRWIDLLPTGAVIAGTRDELPRDEADLLRDLGIAAVAVVPIEVNRRWWGWLAFEQVRTSRDWSPIELDALQAAANVLGASIQRQELTDLLRENEARAEQAYQREREATERLRTLDELKDTFLTAVSHELRTPLTAIRGFANTLLDHHHELDERQQLRMLTRLTSNVERLDGLLRELLDLNRLSQGVIEARPLRVEVAPLLLAAVGRAGDLGEHRVTTHTDLQVARLDRALTDRILDNLLQNALLHTPAGTTITIGATTGPGGVLLSVEDDGPGIPADQAEAIFEPFRHGPTVRQHSPGAGVGLSLVARFATLHGGRAWVEAGAQGGARFQVLLVDVGDPDE